MIIIMDRYKIFKAGFIEFTLYACNRLGKGGETFFGTHLSSNIGFVF